MTEHKLAKHACACGLDVALLYACTAVFIRADTNFSFVSMSAMEAIANVRANAKAKAEPTNMRLTPKAKAASDHCADLAAYNKKEKSPYGDPFWMPESKSKQTRGCITSKV